MSTIEDSGRRPADGLRFWRSPAPAHLVLAFEDVDDDGLGIQVATREQVAQALAFAHDHRAGALLIHCLHGVGRSAAIALPSWSIGWALEPKLRRFRSSRRCDPKRRPTGS